MCKNTNENVNPMPTDGDKRGAAAIKALIGIAAVGNCIMAIPSFALKGKEEHQRNIAICDGISLILTVIDFGLSCGVGYGIYSPMDTSNERIKDSDYKKAITATSDAAGLYSNTWIIKTAVGVLEPSVSTILTIADKKGLDENLWDYLDGFFTILNMGVCCLSMVMEINACVKAGKVDGDKLNDYQKRDKSCFLCETVGYICDDACTIVDGIVSIVEIKNIPVFTAREVLEAAYAISMFVEAGYINKE